MKAGKSFAFVCIKRSYVQLMYMALNWFMSSICDGLILSSMKGPDTEQYRDI